MSGSVNAARMVGSSPATNLRKVIPSPRSNSGWLPEPKVVTIRSIVRGIEPRVDRSASFEGQPA
jgi:hypothetical protein